VAETCLREGLAEAAGHEDWGRMQALLRSYRWDWKELRARLPGLAAAWLPDAVYGRSGRLRKACEKAEPAYVAIIPCDYQVTLPSGAVIRADGPSGTRSSSAARAAPGPKARSSATGP
jgi:hypothetical protein